MRRPPAAEPELQLYQMQAEIAKALAHPIRLRILALIVSREVPYGALLEGIGISKTNLSQHLAILRRSAVLAVRREGRHIHYRLTHPEIHDLCRSMRGILAKRLATTGRQARVLLRRIG